MSLEHPGPGFFGQLGQLGLKPSLKDLDLFVRGYIQSQDDAGIDESEEGWSAFMMWLETKGYFSGVVGWVPKIIEETGDGKPAFDRFKELLFEFLESKKPAWFIEYNLSEQPSTWWRFKNINDYEDTEMIPARHDIRDQKHIHLAAKYA